MPDWPAVRAARHSWGWWAAAVAIAAVVPACSPSSGPAGRQVITLYNGQHQQTTEALVSRFEKATGIKVQERDGDEDQLAEEIEQEGSSTPADVFFSENSPSLMSLEGKHLLERLPADVTSQVPARFNSPTGAWVGVSARVSVMVYNPALISAAQLPASVLDLAAPRYRGKLAIAPTETDLQPVITSVARAEGQKAAVRWLRAVAANGSAHTEPDNETVVSDVNSGRVAFSLVDHYYWYRMAKEVGQKSVHARIAYFRSGDPGYVLDVSGAGVLRSSHHRAAAEALVRFLVSAGGQQTMVGSDSYEYPLVAGVAPPPGLTPFGDLHPSPVTIADLGDGALAVELEQEAQII